MQALQIERPVLDKEIAGNAFGKAPGVSANRQVIPLALPCLKAAA